MASKDSEKDEGRMTLHTIRHARDPENWPSRSERWQALLKKHPKRGERRGSE